MRRLFVGFLVFIINSYCYVVCEVKGGCLGGEEGGGEGGEGGEEEE